MPPSPGDSFQTAKIEVVADTSELKAGLQQAKADVERLAGEMGRMGDAADESTKKAAAGFQDVALKLAGTIAVVVAAVDAFVKLYDTADDFFRGGKDFDFSGAEGGPKERIAAITKEIKELQKTVADRSLLSRADDTLDFYVIGYQSARDKALKDLAEAEKEIRDIQTAERRQSAQEEIERLSIQAADGAEQIEMRRARAVRKARERFQNEADPVVKQINENAAKELADWEAKEKKKTDSELIEIEKRKNAYMDLIRKQEAAAIESNERIAKAAGEAMAREMGAATRQFQAQSMSALGQLVVTMESLAASTEKLANQRRASGL